MMEAGIKHVESIPVFCGEKIQAVDYQASVNKEQVKQSAKK